MKTNPHHYSIPPFSLVSNKCAIRDVGEIKSCANSGTEMSDSITMPGDTLKLVKAKREFRLGQCLQLTVNL